MEPEPRKTIGAIIQRTRTPDELAALAAKRRTAQPEATPPKLPPDWRAWYHGTPSQPAAEPVNGNGHRDDDDDPGPIPPGDLGPRYLGGGQDPRRQEQPLELDGPRFLADDWDEEPVMPAPTILPVTGGVPGLFYEGKSHSISGPGGHGKTWVVLVAIAWLVAHDPAAVAVFVDYEDDRGTFKFRLKALGVTREQARRIAYWRVSESIMVGTEAGARWLTWVDEHRPSFVGLDSVSKACAAAGLNDESNPEFRRWDSGVIGPLDNRGITSVRIDHTGHDDGPGGPKTRTRGASAKTDSVSGVSYLYRAEIRFNKTTSGRGVLTPIKCRCGDMLEGAPIALMDVEVSDGGERVAITFRAPDQTAGHNETFRPTALMERVSRYMEATAPSGPLSQRGIEAGVSGNATYVRAAIAALVAEGYIVIDRTGRSHLHTLIKPYRETDDPLDEHGQEKPKC